MAEVLGRGGVLAAVGAAVVLALGLLACEPDSGSKTSTTPGVGQDVLGRDGAQEDAPTAGGGDVAGQDGGGQEADASAKTCTCETPGVSLQSTCDWPDAEECGGWVSMTVENDPDLKDQEAQGDEVGAMAAALDKAFPSGTEQCAFGCCTTITCP